MLPGGCSGGSAQRRWEHGASRSRRAAHGDDGELGYSARPERCLMGSEVWRAVYGQLCCYNTLSLKPFSPPLVTP